MKTQICNILFAGLVFLIPAFSFSQAPPLGTAADFVLFSSVGAVSNVGTYKYLTYLTGNVGTNSGSSTNFGNVNGVMHDGDGASLQCASDLLFAYNSLSALTTDSTLGPVIGNGTTLKARRYLMPGATSLNLSLTLNAEGNPNAVFIFKTPAAVAYAFTANPNSKIKLINGAQACNVFWQVSGAVNVGAGVVMRGNIIAHGAITMSAQDTIEGRALTVNGAITVSNGALGFLAYTPTGCGSPVLNGPAAPAFVGLGSYAIFATTGSVSDCGTSHITGDVGGNTVAPTGFNPLYVTGSIHFNDPSTSAAAADLLLIYNNLLGLTYDIKLLDPAEFGHNLVLTPHAYQMNAAVTFTDTVYLNAMGNVNAVFIIKTFGAFASTTGSKVILVNGTQAKNVYWFCTGAVSIAPNSIFKGAIIAHDAIDILAGASLDGRAFSTNGGISTCGMSTTIPSNISSGPGNQTVCSGGSASFVITASGTGLTYQWRKGAVSLINGGNISGATTTTLTINPVSLSDAATNYNVIVTEPSLPTNTSANASLTVNPLPLPVITGLASGCTGSVEYSYTTAPGMTGYAWSVSAGGVITAGIASSEITVTWNTAGAKTISVNYTNASGCVAAVPSVFNVTVVPLPVPIITGPSSTCINSGYVNYSTESGMANYVWSVSAGGIINNGFGTNQVQVSWIGSGPQTVSVSYRNGVNCNVSLPTVYSVSVTNMPGQAGTITGTADVCAGTNGITYSVTPVLNASAYIWTLPSDAIISSGMGTNAITVDYGTNATSGTIQVNGNNVCGNGTSSPPLAVSVEPLPDLAGTITGPSSLCQGAASIEYVVDPISNATGYLWSVPTGATIVSGSNTNAITVDFSSIALSGPITVAGTNSCGTGPLVPAFFVSVNAIPATPIITITGNSLQSDSYTGNQWYMDGLPIYGATGQTWEAQQSGWYWDVVTLADCPSEASVHEYLVLVGEQELHAGNIDIYPVPNDGRFTVSIVSPTEEFFSISVFTKLGVQVLEINNIFVNKHVNQIIDMSSAESGIYSILIRNSSNNIVKKVVISR